MSILGILFTFVLGACGGFILASIFGIGASNDDLEKAYNAGRLYERNRVIDSINQIYGVNKQPGLQDTDEAEKETAE